MSEAWKRSLERIRAGEEAERKKRRENRARTELPTLARDAYQAMRPFAECLEHAGYRADAADMRTAMEFCVDHGANAPDGEEEGA